MLEPDNWRVPTPFFGKPVAPARTALMEAVPFVTFAVKAVVNVPGPVIDPLVKRTVEGLLSTPPRLRVPPFTVTPCEARLLVTPADKVPRFTEMPFEKMFAELFKFKVPVPDLTKLVPVRLPPSKVTVAPSFVMVTAAAVIPFASTVIAAGEFKAALSPVLKATAVPVPSVSQFWAVVFQAPTKFAGSHD